MQLLSTESPLHQCLVKLVIYSLRNIITTCIKPSPGKITIKACLTANAEIRVELASGGTHHIQFIHSTDLLLFIETPSCCPFPTRPMLLKELLSKLVGIRLTLFCSDISIMFHLLTFLCITKLISAYWGSL